MAPFSLSSDNISSIINNPSLLKQSSYLAQFGISTSQADYILVKGYNKGFKNIVILNAALTTLAFVASVVLIGHKELLRGDEEQLKKEAKEALRERAGKDAVGIVEDQSLKMGAQPEDIEMGSMASP